MANPSELGKKGTTGDRIHIGALGASVDPQNVRVLHASTSPDGEWIACLTVDDEEISCALTGVELSALLHHSLLVPALRH